jgi:dihydroxyacetone kinase-like protein
MIQDKKNQEILVMIKNYTGDIINFESAVDIISAKYGTSHGVKIKTLQVGDDIALLDTLSDRMKPRGVAGTVLLYKILGGASYQGKKLDHVVALGEDVLKNMFSFGVSFDSCSLPGKPKSHEMGADEIEIGMGIHGEPGKYKTKWMQNKDLVKELLTSLYK